MILRRYVQSGFRINVWRLAISRDVFEGGNIGGGGGICGRGISGDAFGGGNIGGGGGICGRGISGDDIDGVSSKVDNFLIITYLPYSDFG